MSADEEVRIEEIVTAQGRKVVFASKDPAKAAQAAALYRRAIQGGAGLAQETPEPVTHGADAGSDNGSAPHGEEALIALLESKRPFTLPQALRAYAGAQVKVRDMGYRPARDKVRTIIREWSERTGARVVATRQQGKRDKVFTVHRGVDS
jgi:hypothetical protein